MAQSVPPGDIDIQPTTIAPKTCDYLGLDELEIDYSSVRSVNAKTEFDVKVTNSGGRRIGWSIKTNNIKRFGVDPPCGVLDPKEAVLMAVSCDAFQYGEEDTNNDRITIEWTNTPDGAAKTFRREWFQGDVVLLHKAISFEFGGGAIEPNVKQLISIEIMVHDYHPHPKQHSREWPECTELTTIVDDGLAHIVGSRPSYSLYVVGKAGEVELEAADMTAGDPSQRSP